MSRKRIGPARLLLVDKPRDWSSYDVIRALKPAVRGKVGHAGTLDPFATGLLVVLTGQATKIASVIMDLPKEYVATARFGARSTTGDPTGEIAGTGGRTDFEEVREALGSFRGRLQQKVPMTSAVKVGGERLYEKARRGEFVDTPEREVRVYEAELLRFDEVAQEASLLFRTGKGTYIRRLVEDLGDALGTGAYTTELRRIRSGVFAVDQARPPDAFTGEMIAAGNAPALPLDQALAFLPAFPVEGRAAERVVNGNELSGAPGGRFRVVGSQGVLALYEGRGDRARPLAVFSRPEGT